MIAARYSSRGQNRAEGKTGQRAEPGRGQNRAEGATGGIFVNLGLN